MKLLADDLIWPPPSGSQVVEILQKLYSSGADDLGLNFINELTVRFCHCPKWVGRQAFAFICQVCGASLTSAAGANNAFLKKQSGSLNFQKRNLKFKCSDSLVLTRAA